MTLAELQTATRNLCNVFSADTGATLTDTVLDDLLNDAAEQVVLDLAPYFPDIFATLEQVNLVTGDNDYTLTNAGFLQVLKVEKNVTDEQPKEVTITDVLSKWKYGSTGQTGADPKAVYFIGETLYVVPTPSEDKTSYLNIYLVMPEAATIAAGGPTKIPRVAHRLIAYRASVLAATMYDSNTMPYERQYAQRLEQVKRTLHGRYQQQPRFVRDSVEERSIPGWRDPVLYDTEWE